MSSWGLEIRNGLGFTSLDPDTFTVKLVESVWVGWEVLDSTTVVDVPTSTDVLAGMFAIITVYDSPTPFNADLQILFQSEATGTPLALPVVEIYNGFIRVKGQPIVNSRSTGMVVVSIMTYV